MSIEFYSFGAPHPAGVEEHFRSELLAYMKKVNSAKVFFIHNPRIGNMLMTDIDLLLIITNENKLGNFHKFNKKYLYNIVIPIKFIDEKSFYGEDCEIFSKYKVENKYEYNVGALVEGKFTHEQEYSYTEILKNLGWQSKKYLEKIIGYTKLTTHPIVWIITNDEKSYYFGESNILRAPKFGFRELTAYFYYHPDKNTSLKSVYEWDKNFEKVEKDFEKIALYLEKDSIIGSLTKKKIERISQEFHNDMKIYERYLSDNKDVNTEIIDNFVLDFGKETSKKKSLPKRIKAEKSLDNNIVIINGKAGSGKTSELYLLMKKCYENKKKVRFLTYNQMLRNDAKIISCAIREKNPLSNEITVKTIQQLTYKMADRLGILAAMSQERFKELQNTLTERASKIISFWHNNFKNKNVGIKYSDIPFNILDLGSNKLLRKFLNRHVVRNEKEYIFIKNFQEEFKNFIKNEEKIISELSEKNIFLSDYFGVLKLIYYSFYLDRENSEKAKYFWKHYESIYTSPDGNKDSVWERITERRSPNAGYNNSKEDIKKMINRTLGQFKKYMTIIDEGQDFHEFERDILLKLAEDKHIVVATGGKEQLIRFDKECRWDNSHGRKIAYFEINKRNTSFRMKERIVDLCNYIADKFYIDLKIKTENNKDKGRIFISAKKDNNKLISIYNQLDKEGKKSQYSRYENIIFLLDTNSEYYLSKMEFKITSRIDEDDNTSKNINKTNKIKLHKILGIDKENFWLHNMSFIEDKEIEKDDEAYFNEENEDYPTPQQHRVIYYESCRGLEAWAVMCFDIDSFYDRKKNEDAAARFCSDDLTMTEDMRRSKYAATQVLMALTRAIDTLYIEIKDPNSELGKIIMEYVDIHEEVKVDNYLQDFCDNDNNKEFDDDDILF